MFDMFRKKTDSSKLYIYPVELPALTEGDRLREAILPKAHPLSTDDYKSLVDTSKKYGKTPYKEADIARMYYARQNINLIENKACANANIQIWYSPTIGVTTTYRISRADNQQRRGQWDYVYDPAIDRSFNRNTMLAFPFIPPCLTRPDNDKMAELVSRLPQEDIKIYREEKAWDAKLGDIMQALLKQIEVSMETSKTISDGLQNTLYGADSVERMKRIEAEDGMYVVGQMMDMLVPGISGKWEKYHEELLHNIMLKDMFNDEVARILERALFTCQDDGLKLNRAIVFLNAFYSLFVDSVPGDGRMDVSSMLSVYEECMKAGFTKEETDDIWEFQMHGIVDAHHGPEYRAAVMDSFSDFLSRYFHLLDGRTFYRMSTKETTRNLANHMRCDCGFTVSRHDRRQIWNTIGTGSSIFTEFIPRVVFY